MQDIAYEEALAIDTKKWQDDIQREHEKENEKENERKKQENEKKKQENEKKKQETIEEELRRYKPDISDLIKIKVIFPDGKSAIYELHKCEKVLLFIERLKHDLKYTRDLVLKTMYPTIVYKYDSDTRIGNMNLHNKMVYVEYKPTVEYVDSWSD
jgi:hypothetical protein